MDYYARKQRELAKAERRETIKTWLTAVAILPVLWVFMVLFLSI